MKSNGANSRKQAIGHLFIFLTIFTIQAVHLDSDPSPLAWSHEINDEGFWNHSARCKVLFDTFVPDEFNQGIVAAPLFTLLQWPVFSVLGVSIFSARLLPLASLWLILVMLYVLIRRQVSANAALLTVAMLGLLHEMIFYTKWSTPVLPQACFLTAVLFFWELSKTGNRWWAAVAGATYVAAVLTTLLAIHCLPGIILFLAADWLIRKEANRKQVILFLGAAALIGILVLLGYYLPNLEQVRIFARTVAKANVTKTSDFQGSFYVPEPNYMLPFLIPFSSPGVAPLMMIATLWLVDSILRTARDGILTTLRQMPAVQLYSLCWILGPLPSLLMLPYMPPRRFVIFFVPLAVLTSSFVWRIAASRGNDETQKVIVPKGLPRILIWGVVVVIWCAYLWRAEYAANMLWLFKTPWAISQTVTMAACCVAAVLAGLYFFARQPTAVVLSLLCVFFGVNLLLTYIWYSHATYTIRDASREIGALTKRGEYFVNFWTFELSLENQCYPVYSPWDENKNINHWFFEESKRTGFVAMDNAGRELIREFPADRVKILRQINIHPVIFNKDRTLVNYTLYRIEPLITSPTLPPDP